MAVAGTAQHAWPVVPVKRLIGMQWPANHGITRDVATTAAAHRAGSVTADVQPLPSCP